MMRFLTALDIILLPEVTVASAPSAHIAPHGIMKNLFKLAFEEFFKAAPVYTMTESVKSSWKTINDRFKRLIANHRDGHKRNYTLSVINDFVGELELL